MKPKRTPFSTGAAAGRPVIARYPLNTPVHIPFDDQRLKNLKDALPRDPNPKVRLELSWAEVLRGAILCGVAGWHERRKHGVLGGYEVSRRLLHLLSHLELRVEAGEIGLYRTPIYESEDGSEKSGSSYLIGMAMTLAVSRATRQARALLHFDGVHGAGGVRPDLVGAEDPNGHFLEVKGRVDPVDQAAMDSAVRQLREHRLKKHTRCAAAIATGFRGPRLQVHRQHFHKRRLSRGEALDLLDDDATADAEAQVMLQWEPLALAIWYAAQGSRRGSAGQLRFDNESYLFIRLAELDLIVGMSAGAFESATTRLRRDEIITDRLLVNPTNADSVELTELSDRYEADDLLLGWGRDVDLEQIEESR